MTNWAYLLCFWNKCVIRSAYIYFNTIRVLGKQNNLIFTIVFLCKCRWCLRIVCAWFSLQICLYTVNHLVLDYIYSKEPVIIHYSKLLLTTKSNSFQPKVILEGSKSSDKWLLILQCVWCTWNGRQVTQIEVISRQAIKHKYKPSRFLFCMKKTGSCFDTHSSIKKKKVKLKYDTTYFYNHIFLWGLETIFLWAEG